MARTVAGAMKLGRRSGGVEVRRAEGNGQPGGHQHRACLRRLRVAAGAAAIAACLPYAALKVVWLLGGSVGSATAEGAAELHDGRHVAGNVATLAMVAVAVLLALTLTHPRGQRLPPALVLLPVWLGTGLLAPIALGLPLGLVAQAIAGGSPAPADNGLHGWVYAVVYGGFLVEAVALTAAFVLYARVRWTALLELRMPEPARGKGQRLPRILAHSAAAAAVLYAVANLAWAVGGNSLAAPPGFETAAQRSLLVSTALLALAGAFAVLQLVGHRPIRRLPDRLWVPLTLAWVGSAAGLASGLSQYALAADAGPHPSTSLLLAVGSTGGLLMGAVALRSVVGRPLGAGRLEKGLERRSRGVQVSGLEPRDSRGDGVPPRGSCGDRVGPSAGPLRQRSGRGLGRRPRGP